MRINVYTEELNPVENPGFEVVTADYISARTGKPMTNFGIRVYLKSHPDIHCIPGRDDDRSAVTFWCADIHCIPGRDDDRSAVTFWCGDSMNKLRLFAWKLHQASHK